MFDNMNGNKNFNNNMSNTIDNFNSIFSNKQDNNIENIQNNNDLPPVLDQITYLNNAPVIEAPSMNPLEPIDTFNNYESKDRLEEYENGNLYSVPSNNLEDNQSYSLSNNNELEQYKFDLPLNNFDFTNNPLPNISNEENNVLNAFNNNETYNNDNLISNISNEYNFNYNGGVNLENDNSLFTPNLSETKEDLPYEIIQENISLNENNNINENSVLSDNIIPESKNQSINEDYEIIQEKKLSDTSSTLLNDYNIYDEPDTLEIMDLDSDILSSNENKEQNIPIETSLYDSVEKIKELVEQIKLNGIKIDIEEFDFEEMYQLIVKIEK